MIFRYVNHSSHAPYLLGSDESQKLTFFISIALKTHLPIVSRKREPRAISANTHSRPRTCTN